MNISRFLLTLLPLVISGVASLCAGQSDTTAFDSTALDTTSVSSEPWTPTPPDPGVEFRTDTTQTCMLLIPCAEIDTAAAINQMLNSTAKELAIDRAKCLSREWRLIGRTETLHLQTVAAKKDERSRCDETIRLLEDNLYKEQGISDRMRPWALIGKFVVGFAVLGGGVVLYNAVR